MSRISAINSIILLLFHAIKRISPSTKKSVHSSLQVGFRACIVAVLGTVLPLAAGTLLTMAYNKPFFPMGVAAGTALAPTSVGIALRLLGEAGVLKEDFGQAAGGGWSWFLDEVREKWLVFCW